MLNQHHQLLLAYKALKTRVVWVIWISGHNLGTVAPNHILRLWKQFLHQLVLARELDFNMSGTKSTTSAAGTICLESINSIDSLLKIYELHVTVQCLTCYTFHNDMNRFIFGLSDDSSIATQKSQDLRSVDRIWNLV